MFEVPDIPPKPDDAARCSPAPKAAALSPTKQAAVSALRERIALMERLHARSAPGGVISLEIPAIDRILPHGGLALHALHEAASSGPDTEHAAAATLFVAGILARMDGPVLWVLRQADLFAPGLAGAGLHPGRVIFAEAGREVLGIMEEGLRHPGLAAVVGEPGGKVGLVASRRLQLAAEQGGVMAILIRRSQVFDDPAHHEPTAAFTRWRITALPLAGTPDEMPRPHWRIELTRCRGAETGAWIVEACDATGRLGVVALSAGRPDQAA